MLKAQQKCLYIVCQKTGSTSVRNLLAENGYKPPHEYIEKDKLKSILCEKDYNYIMELPCFDHLPAFAIKKYLEYYTDIKWADLHVFTTVRNPWDRHVSSYRYRINQGSFKGTFDEFVKSPWFKLTRPIDYMCIDPYTGTDLVTQYIDMNDLDRSICAMKSKLDIKGDIPFLNRTVSKSAKDQLNEMLVRLKNNSETMNTLTKYINVSDLDTIVSYINVPDTQKSYREYYNSDNIESVRRKALFEIEKFRYTY